MWDRAPRRIGDGAYGEERQPGRGCRPSEMVAFRIDDRCAGGVEHGSLGLGVGEHVIAAGNLGHDGGVPVGECGQQASAPRSIGGKMLPIRADNVAGKDNEPRPVLRIEAARDAEAHQRIRTIGDQAFHRSDCTDRGSAATPDDQATLGCGPGQTSMIENSGLGLKPGNDAEFRQIWRITSRTA